jgi:hypothetical protein
MINGGAAAYWIPAFAGMTILRAGRCSQKEAGYGFAAGSLPAVS